MINIDDEERKNLAALGTLTGLILLADDKADIGKFDRPHHWQIGAFLFGIGLWELLN